MNFVSQNKRTIIFGFGFLLFAFIAVSSLIWWNSGEQESESMPKPTMTPSTNTNISPPLSMSNSSVSQPPASQPSVGQSTSVTPPIDSTSNTPVETGQSSVVTSSAPADSDGITDNEGEEDDSENAQVGHEEGEDEYLDWEECEGEEEEDEYYGDRDDKYDDIEVEDVENPMYFRKYPYQANPETPFAPKFSAPEKEGISKDSDLVELPVIPLREVTEEGIVGIVNRGNSCYANSCIQALFRIPMLRKIVANFDTIYRPVADEKILDAELKLAEMEGELRTCDPADAQRKDSLEFRIKNPRRDVINLKRNVLILEGLNHMFSQLQYNENGTPAVFDFEKSEQCMQGKFHYFDQEDADEYMTGLHDALVQFIPHIQEKRHISLIIGKSMKYLAKDPENNTRHNTHINNTQEVYSKLSLPMEKDVESDPYTLDSLMKAFFRVSNEAEYKFDDETSYNGFVEQTPMILSLPNIVPIQIKRTSFDPFGLRGAEKINDPVDIPAKIDFAPYCHRNIKVSTNYELKMFIYHIGETFRSGHYVTYTREKDGNWYLLDDNKVIMLKSKRATPFNRSGSRIFVHGIDGKIYRETKTKVKVKKGEEKYITETECITDTGYIYFYKRIQPKK